jgi:hypothetical protein
VNYRRDAQLAIFVLFCGLIGGFIYNPVDPVNYGRGSLIFYTSNIYQLDRGAAAFVYSPIFYAVPGILFTIIEFLGYNLTASSYGVIATFAAIGAGAQSLVYVFGLGVISDRYQREWLIGSLLNPFALFVTVVYGQMEIFGALGFISVIYIVKKEKFRRGSLYLTLASSVKLYPAVLFVPLIVRNKKRLREIIIGTIPIAVPTAILMLLLLPDSLTIFVPGGVLPWVDASSVVILNLLTFGVLEGWVSVIFLAIFAISVLISLHRTIRAEIAYLIPIMCVGIFYPTFFEYRWLPVSLSFLLLGYLDTDWSTGLRQVFQRLGWLMTGAGTLGMVLLSINGTVKSRFEVNWLPIFWKTTQNTSDIRMLLVVGVFIVLIGASLLAIYSYPDFES